MFIIIIVIIVKKEDFLSPDDRVAQSRLLAGVCRKSPSFRTLNFLANS